VINTNDVGHMDVQKRTSIIGTSWWISTVNCIHEYTLHVIYKWNWSNV
jgi:hypothetical protein